jgi:hypothetical protein
MSNIPENQSKDTFGWLWALFFVFVAALVLFSIFWNMYEQDVKNLVLTMAYYLRNVQLPFAFLMNDSYKGALFNLPNLYVNLYNTQYDDAFISPLLTISLRSIAIVFAIVAIPRAIYLIIRNDQISYTRHMNLRDLIAIMRERYPRIKPTTARWLLHEDSRFGSLGSQLNPIELLAHKGLIELCDLNSISDPDKRFQAENGLENLKIAGLKEPRFYLPENTTTTIKEYAGLKYPTGNLNAHNKEMEFFFDNIELFHGLIRVSPQKLKDFYLTTLGPRCRYVGNFIDIRMLPPIERSLWVLCMACIAQRKDLRKKINGLLDQFADSFVEGDFNSNEHQINLDGIDELYQSVVKEKSVLIELARIAKAHGYYYTAFTELYTVAKDRFGTITTQDFRWLKITNRILFYALNQIGLERARYETAAIRSHYLAEKKRRRGLGGKIAKPQVDSAVLNTIFSLDFEEWTAQPLTYEDIEPESPTFMRACWINVEELK